MTQNYYCDDTLLYSSHNVRFSDFAFNNKKFLGYTKIRHFPPIYVTLTVNLEVLLCIRACN